MIYYVVFAKDHPLALVKVDGTRTRTIAGNSVAERYFSDGEPDLSTDLPMCFQPICTECWHPLIGEWTDKLSRHEKNNRKSLSSAERAEVKRLKQNEMRLQDVANRFGVSVSTVKRV
jgi:hypothetical protein